MNFKLWKYFLTFKGWTFGTLTLFSSLGGTAHRTPRSTHGLSPVSGEGVQNAQFRPLRLDTLDTPLGKGGSTSHVEAAPALVPPFAAAASGTPCVGSNGVQMSRAPQSARWTPSQDGWTSGRGCCCLTPPPLPVEPWAQVSKGVQVSRAEVGDLDILSGWLHEPQRLLLP